jgi:F-type H+-transporting ATPase subunit b
MGPFTVNLGLMLWTWLVFIALFLLLRRFAWPAILSATEAREKRIAAQLAETERMNADARAALEEHKKLLAGSREEALVILAEAKSRAEKEHQHILEKARAEQEEVLDRAKREIEAERDRAITELRKEAVDLSLAAAERLIEQRLDDTANRKLVTDFLATLGERS